MTDDVYCVEDGCRQPATHERPLGMIGDDLVVELVCADHRDETDLTHDEVVAMWGNSEPAVVARQWFSITHDPAGVVK